MKRKTIIISDLHLGSPEAKTQQLLNFLEKNSCKTLIINGDLIDGLYIKILGKRKTQYDIFFKKLNKIIKKNQTKINYIRGNHEVFIDNITTLKQFKIQDNIIYKSNNNKYFICHGHQFDKINHKLGLLAYISFFAGRTFYAINTSYNNLRYRFGLKSHSLIKIARNIAEKISGGKDTQKKLIELAKKNKCDKIICSHTHKPTITNNYLNPGDRVEHCSALAEDEKGNRKIIYHKE